MKNALTHTNTSFAPATSHAEDPADSLPPAEQRRARARSLVSQLTLEQEAQLYQWLAQYSVPEVLRRVQAPPPEGFGIHTHSTTLHRIKSALHGAHLSSVLDRQADVLADAQDPIDSAQSARAESLLSHLLQQKALELIRTSPASRKFGRLIDSMTKLSALEHKRQRLAFEREKLQLRSNPGCQRHRVDLNIIPPCPTPAPARNPAPILSAPSVPTRPPLPSPAPGTLLKSCTAESSG